MGREAAVPYNVFQSQNSVFFMDDAISFDKFQIYGFMRAMACIRILFSSALHKRCLLFWSCEEQGWVKFKQSRTCRHFFLHKHKLTAGCSEE